MERRTNLALVAPALIWTAAFFVVPLVLMAAMSLWTRTAQGIERTWTLANYARVFGRPAILDGLVNSLQIAAIVTVVSILLAYPLAWFIATVLPPAWRRLALTLAVIPFWTSYVVRSYAWLLLLSEGGYVNRALLALAIVDAPLRIAATRAATTIGFVHFFVMLATLTIYASLAQLPENYLRAAADLGASRRQTFLHVVLPLTLPGAAVGAFMTFVLCVGDYVTPQILGGNNELTLTQIVVQQIGRRADFPAAAAMALVLTAVVLAAYLLAARWLKAART